MAGVLSLPEHLRAMGSTPFTWGTSDCCLAASDWMLACRGIDPAAPLRGRYTTMRGALRHIRRLGGFEAMVSDLMRDAGFVETTEPKIGDVGVVDSDQGQALAIRTQIGWAVKGVNGFVVAPFSHTKAWSV
ncbi:hypothetical protein FPV16_23890 [Methylobacterium sp. W2]|uniref:DUF6950 family protein n=1 Tax=Methylobacterium sp. W2 TaxID=2598107 RepID=UPI001D0C14E5|nr:hypothetical protein [Methylobacterium sp. W2]MCC0809201.1 hypothetical protein [Methylobacterium sp. W2]